MLIGAWHCPYWHSPQAQLLWAQKYHILISALWQRQSGSSSDTSLLPSAWVQTAKYLVPVVTVDSISRNAVQLENIFSLRGKSLHGYVSSQQTQESIMVHIEINSNAIESSQFTKPQTGNKGHVSTVMIWLIFHVIVYDYWLWGNWSFCWCCSENLAGWSLK